MASPKISVIIPVYNISRYLPQCLDSIIHQTFSNFEVLCVDDGSTDNSIQIIKSYQERDHRILLFQQMHQGVSAARNLGLQNVSGEYIIFIDGDDWVEATLLETMLHKAISSNCDIVTCSAQVHFSSNATFSARQKRMLQKSLSVKDSVWTLSSNSASVWQFLKLPGSWPFIWNKLIRTSILTKNAITFSPVLALGEDGVFLQILFQYVTTAAFLAPALYHYRYQRNESATSTLAQDIQIRFQHHIDVVSELIHAFSTRGILNRNSVHLLEWILFFLYSDYLKLPSDHMQAASSTLLDLFLKYQLIPFCDKLSPVYQERFHIMLYHRKKFGTLTQFVYRYKTKVENLIIRLLKR